MDAAWKWCLRWSCNPWKFSQFIKATSAISGSHLKGEHKCTHGWPRSVPTGLQAFKIQTQIQASNRVQVTQICGSSTCKNTSTCHLIKKSDTSKIQTGGDLTFKTGDALDHWAIYTWDDQNIKCAYTKSCRKLKYILYKGFSRHWVWS